MSETDGEKRKVMQRGRNEQEDKKDQCVSNYSHVCLFVLMSYFCLHYIFSSFYFGVFPVLAAVKDITCRVKV